MTAPTAEREPVCGNCGHKARYHLATVVGESQLCQEWGCRCPRLIPGRVA